jgi:hypothetical protein
MHMKQISKRRKRSSRVTPREYDFSKGVRGKYARAFLEGTNLVVLDPDVAEMFPTSTAVNDALRALVKIARGTEPRKRVRKRRAPTRKR